MRAAIVKKNGLAEPRNRGSKSGVKRGNYKPRRIQAPEPQTPEELSALQKRCREYWGAQLFDRGGKVYSPEHGRYMSVQTFVPADRITPESDKHDAEVTSKTCRGCGLDLDLSNFSQSKTGAHGVGGKCKSCRAEDAREYASTPQGKAARARALAKHAAQVKAREQGEKHRAALLERASGTPGGRKFLALLGWTPVLNQENKKC